MVKIWDFESGEQVRTLNQAGKGVTGLRWVPGKPLLFGASGDSNGPRVESRQRVGPPDLPAASDYLFAVAASADGGRVAAGGADGVLMLWNGTTGSLLRKIPDAK